MTHEYKKQKQLEGNSHLNKADKYLEVSWLKLKTSPDYDSAVIEYESAATCFTNAEMKEEAVKAHEKAAELHIKLNTPYHAATHIQKAAFLLREDTGRCCALIEKASQLFSTCGNISTAASILAKGAKILEQTNDDSSKATAVTMLEKAFNLEITTSRTTEAIEHLDRASKVLLTLKRFAEARKFVERALELYESQHNNNMIYRTGIHLIVVSLYMDDIRAAEEAHLRVGHVDSEMNAETGALIAAYKNGDQSTVSRIVTSQTFVYTENEFARLANNLKVPSHRLKSSDELIEQEWNARASGQMVPGEIGGVVDDDDWK